MGTYIWGSLCSMATPWCGVAQARIILKMYSSFTPSEHWIIWVLSCMLLPQERWNFEEMQSGVTVARPAWGNPIPVHLLHLSRGKVGCDFWKQLCTEARVPFNDMVNTRNFRIYIEQHSVKKFYLFMLLQDWVKINMSTAKFQVEVHFTYCDQLIVYC